MLCIYRIEKQNAIVKFNKRHIGYEHSNTKWKYKQNKYESQFNILKRHPHEEFVF